MGDQPTKEEFENLLHEAIESKRAMITLFQDKDGNWRGGYMKTDSNDPIFARQIGPDTVLQMLLTDSK